MLFSHIWAMELEKYATVLQVGHGKNMNGKWENRMALLQDPHLATFLILGLT